MKLGGKIWAKSVFRRRPLTLKFYPELCEAHLPLRNGTALSRREIWRYMVKKCRKVAISPPSERSFKKRESTLLKPEVNRSVFQLLSPGHFNSDFMNYLDLWEYLAHIFCRSKIFPKTRTLKNARCGNQNRQGKYVGCNVFFQRWLYVRSQDTIVNSNRYFSQAFRFRGSWGQVRERCESRQELLFKYSKELPFGRGFISIFRFHHKF